jgi:hypothetical protein
VAEVGSVVIDVKWWHCRHCNSNIRSLTEPTFCICGSHDISELWVTDPPPNQGQLLRRGSVQGDWLHPDRWEDRARALIVDLLKMLDDFTPTEHDRVLLEHRAVRARAHWLPFVPFVHNGRVVGKNYNDDW